MVKTKILKKQKKSSEKLKAVILTEHRSADYDFNQPGLVKKILAECILDGDMNTFEDVFLAYIRSQSKVKLAAKSKLGRQTLYDLLSDDHKFNPEWETLSSILKAI